VINFTLCPQDNKKPISGAILQPAKNLGLFVILQPAKNLGLFVILSGAKNLFFHFLNQEILRLYSLRMTDKVIIYYSKRRISYFLEFLEGLIIIDLTLE
jgi:hypothetical protein